jgi:hypothetical protein
MQQLLPYVDEAQDLMTLFASQDTTAEKDHH